MLMTGKGGVPVDRKRAYEVFDRACRAEHGGKCTSYVILFAIQLFFGYYSIDQSISR